MASRLRVYLLKTLRSISGLPAEQLLGQAAQDRLGAAVDLSNDGTKLLVGTPGSGSVSYYEWSGTAWEESFTSSDSTESLGTTVALVFQNGSQLAAGAPSAGAGGIVRVFDQGGTQVGSDIVGSAGEELGSTLVATRGRVIAGLATGGFRAYEFDGTDWVEVETGPSTDSPVSSISSSADGNTVVTGLQSEEIYVFDLAA